MAFPTMNAISHGGVVTTVAVISDTNTWFKAPAPIDVSGMEFTFALSTTKAAASASTYSVVVNDGGTTGTAAAALFTAVTNSPSTGSAWTDITVRNVAGTSATDLDADDVLNLTTITGGTAATGFSAAVAYVYGVPGGIN